MSQFSERKKLLAHMAAGIHGAIGLDEYNAVFRARRILDEIERQEADTVVIPAPSAKEAVAVVEEWLASTNTAQIALGDRKLTPHDYAIMHEVLLSLLSDLKSRGFDR